MFACTRAIAVLALLAAPFAYAADFVPGTQVAVEGKIAALENSRSFWMEVGDQRVLVYGSERQRERLFPGLVVQVEGRVSDDFIRLADIELEARSIRSVYPARSVTAALQR